VVCFAPKWDETLFGLGSECSSASAVQVLGQAHCLPHGCLSLPASHHPLLPCLLQVVARLCRAPGVLMDAPDLQGRSPLHLAASQGHDAGAVRGSTLCCVVWAEAAGRQGWWTSGLAERERRVLSARLSAAVGAMGAAHGGCKPPPA